MPRTSLLLRVRAGLRRAVTEELGFKTLSLVLAAVIWAWVQGGLVVEQRTRAEVHYTWPDGLVRVEEVPTSVVITVSGPRAAVSRLTQRRPVIEVNLADHAEGASSVDFSLSPIAGLPADSRLVHISPPSVEVTLEPRQSRVLPVTPTLTGEPAEGFKLIGARVTPDTVEITGAQSLLRDLTEVQTDLVDISGIRADRDMHVPLALPSRTLTASSRGPVEVHVDVEPVRADRHFNDVPVSVSAPGWRASPATAHVVLMGPLVELTALRAAAVSLRVELPDPPPEHAIRVGQADGPPRLVVVHPGSAEIGVQLIEPSAILVEKSPE